LQAAVTSRPGLFGASAQQACLAGASAGLSIWLLEASRSRVSVAREGGGRGHRTSPVTFCGFVSAEWKK